MPGSLTPRLRAFDIDVYGSSNLGLPGPDPDFHGWFDPGLRATDVDV
ncbi:MAG: hypothetical protein M3P40_04695 [Actinomycetota bacterium]|nr:hypothetical protein [Actinomycetota bacterium]